MKQLTKYFKTYCLRLDIQCPDELNEPYHPSVLYFEEGWAGHQYWMAQSPFPLRPPKYRDSYENPCIYYSDDGVHFTTIDDNPIDKLTEEQLAGKCYFSDPQLVMRDGVLECFYRFSRYKDGVQYNHLYKKQSTDGIHWGEREVVIILDDETKQIWGDNIISQSIIWSPENGYECWYVDKSNWYQDRHLRYISSNDGKQWNQSVVCALIGIDTIPWHLHVDKDGDMYRMIMYDMSRDCLDLYLSKDKTNYIFQKVIWKPSRRVGDFYSNGLYRSCWVKAKNHYNIYFSASNLLETSIGLLQTDDWSHFQLVNGGSSWQKLFYLLRTFLMTSIRAIRNRIRKLYFFQFFQPINK